MPYFAMLGAVRNCQQFLRNEKLSFFPTTPHPQYESYISVDTMIYDPAEQNDCNPSLSVVNPKVPLLDTVTEV